MELILLRDFDHSGVTKPKTSKSMKKGDCVSFLQSNYKSYFLGTFFESVIENSYYFSFASLLIVTLDGQTK